MILQTSRLTLRQIEPGDATAIHAYRSLPQVARLQSWSKYKLSDAEELVLHQQSTLIDTPGTWFQLAIISQATQKLIGDCGIHFPADEPWQVELGITLEPANQGQGMACEALRSVVEYLIGHLNKQCVMAVVDAENHAAISLFDRLGFRQQSIGQVLFKGVWCQEITFAVHADEWR